MKKQTFEGRLISYERLNNSTNGNPKYKGILADENGNVLEVKTATDSSLGYSFTNYANKVVTVTYHTTPRRLDNIVDDITN